MQDALRIDFIVRWSPESGSTPAAPEPRSAAATSLLPVHRHRKLELPRVVRRSRLSRVGKERAYRRHIVAVGEVEHVSDEFHIETLVEVDPLGHAEVVEDVPRRNAGVAAEVAVG